MHICFALPLSVKPKHGSASPRHALKHTQLAHACAGPQPGTELHHVLLQVYFPQQGVCIAFSPSGVRAPQRATQGQPGRAPAAAEPYSEEAFNFTRHHCLQREVTLAVHFKSLLFMLLITFYHCRDCPCLPGLLTEPLYCRCML